MEDTDQPTLGMETLAILIFDRFCQSTFNGADVMTNGDFVVGYFSIIE